MPNSIKKTNSIAITINVSELDIWLGRLGWCWPYILFVFFAPDCTHSYLHITNALWWQAINRPTIPLRTGAANWTCVCVFAVGKERRGVPSVNLCQAIYIHNTAIRERRGGKSEEEQDQWPRGTGNKWSGRKTKSMADRKRATVNRKMETEWENWKRGMSV